MSFSLASARWCAFIVVVLLCGAAGLQGLRVDGVRAQTQPAKTPAELGDGVPVLWQEPTDLARRDLFYGLGGREGAPDPNGKFVFLADKGEPDDSNPKIDVKDAQGREWTVKFGPEAKPETTVTRLVWAVGYHVDQDYFVKQATIEGFSRLPTQDMRFEREDDGTKKVGRWKWEDNPFVGTRELDGLKTLMALVNNVDLTEMNNRIVRFKHQRTPPTQLIYYVNDLGAALGSTGAWFTRLPWLDKARTESKGNVEDFVKSEFIVGVPNGAVDFGVTRRQADHIVSGVKIEHARWMGELLGRLSDKQLTDAFQAGGFSDEEVRQYVRELRARIAQLRNLKASLASSGKQ